MKLRFLLSLSLFAVLLLSSCAPASTESVVLTTPAEANTPPVDAPSPTLEAVLQPTLELTPTQAVDVLPVATSRGPELHATDPTTVSLATGQLHFVEFFRFT
ncbi:MAG TPA: hypothetical protein VFQ23_25225 [Anaerolineales bacterium]|nr:hypothetical protein [Anaerolineales bacterium]